MAKEKKPRKKKKYNLKTLLVNKIRSVWRFSPLKKEVKDRAKLPDGFYRCEKCRAKVDCVEVDHLSPAVDPKIGWIGYDEFISRLFCDIINLQAICVRCHDKKSDRENKVRRSKKKLDSASN